MLTEVTLENVHEVARYHAPTADQPMRFERISAAAENLMCVILENAPRCPDRTRAINAARDARMLANSAVALENVGDATNHT